MLGNKEMSVVEVRNRKPMGPSKMLVVLLEKGELTATEWAEVTHIIENTPPEVLARMLLEHDLCSLFGPDVTAVRNCHCNLQLAGTVGGTVRRSSRMRAVNENPTAIIDEERDDFNFVQEAFTRHN